MQNLCQFAKPPPAQAKVNLALPVLKHLVESSQDTETLSDACWAIHYLTMGAAERLHAVLKSGLAKPIVEFLKYSDTRLVLPALQAACNITGGTAAQTDHLLSLGVLPALRTLMTHPDGSIVKESCWAISNIAAGTAAQVQAIIESGIVLSVVNVAQSGEFRTRIEACHVIANLFQSQNVAAAIYTVDQEGLSALISNLEATLDASDLKCFLQGILNALRVGNGADRDFAEDIEEMPHGVGKIEQMADYHDEGVAKVARDILDEFFAEDSDDED